MTPKDVMFITDCLAVNPEQGLSMLDRSSSVPEEVKDAVRHALQGDFDDVSSQVEEAIRRLLADPRIEVNMTGRVLQWSLGNFREPDWLSRRAARRKS